MENGKKRMTVEIIRFIITVLGAILGTLGVQSCC